RVGGGARAGVGRALEEAGFHRREVVGEHRAGAVDVARQDVEAVAEVGAGDAGEDEQDLVVGDVLAEGPGGDVGGRVVGEGDGRVIRDVDAVHRQVSLSDGHVAVE